MAIKVNGTTVVNDSRSLTNIASIDATTEAAISAAGFSQTTGDITAVTAGSGLTGGGTSGAVTINHQDTSSQGSVNNSGNTVIQDITLDTYGHITGINSTTISSSPPTTFNAVGTYAFLYGNIGHVAAGSTWAGSSLHAAGLYSFSSQSFDGTDGYSVGNPSINRANATVSGTWRAMGRAKQGDTPSSATRRVTLFVRIS